MREEKEVKEEEEEVKEGEKEASLPEVSPMHVIRSAAELLQRDRRLTL